MRIGLIAPPWIPVPPPAYGGTESVIDRLARGLVRDGHDVRLAAAANSTCPVRLVAGTDEAADGAPANGGAVTELRHVVTSYAAMGDVDVIHDHTMCGPVYRHRPVGVPVVTTNHGPFDDTLNPIYRALRDVPVIAISHSQASTAHGARIAAVIHHGIDVAAVPEGRGRGGYAGFLGRMSPDKGPREAALIARAAGVPLKMAAKLREPAERAYFDPEIPEGGRGAAAARRSLRCPGTHVRRPLVVAAASGSLPAGGREPATGHAAAPRCWSCEARRNRSSCRCRSPCYGAWLDAPTHFPSGAGPWS